MLKIGLVGCGVISQIHIPIIMEEENCELVAICDINKNNLKKAIEGTNCNGYTNYEEMINNEQLDVIHICTPHYLHKNMIVLAAKKGIHVLCEKPVVMNVDEAKEVIKITDGLNAKIGVVFQNRYNPTNLKIKEYVENEYLGKVIGLKAFLTWYRPENYYTESDWRGTYEYEGGGLLINQSIHTLDLMQWLMGEPHWISGSFCTKTLDCIEVEDTSEAFIKFKNGAKSIFYATNGYIENSPLYMEVAFEKGKLKLDDDVLTCITNSKREEVVKDIPSGDLKSYYGKSHKKLIQKFYKAVIDDTEDYISFKHGIEALKLIEGIRKSQNSGDKYYY